MMEVGKTYKGKINGVIFKVTRFKIDDRGNKWFFIRVNGEKEERCVSSCLQLQLEEIKNFDNPVQGLLF